MYKIVFQDNSIFEGGEPSSSKWNTMPNKPIKSLTYIIGNNEFRLENYEAYNHIVEYTVLLEQAPARITRAIVMGRQKNRVFKVIFDYTHHKLFCQTSNVGQEYKNKPTSGWKVGLQDKAPSYVLLR